MMPYWFYFEFRTQVSFIMVSGTGYTKHTQVSADLTAMHNLFDHVPQAVWAMMFDTAPQRGDIVSQAS